MPDAGDANMSATKHETESEHDSRPHYHLADGTFVEVDGELAEAEGVFLTCGLPEHDAW